MPAVLTPPTAGDLHVNQPLTNFGQKWIQDQENFVAGMAGTPIPVKHKTDLYWEWNRADFFRDEAAERADGAESAGAGYDLTTGTYACKRFGFHKDVTDDQRANADPGANPDEVATQFVTQKMLIRKEIHFMSRIIKTSTWTGSTTGGDITPGTKWDAATGDPIKDIRAQIAAILGKTGMRPNRMLFSRPSWNAVLDNANVLDRISGGATAAMPAKVQRQLIASILELDEVFVMDAVYNAAAKGATEDTKFAVVASGGNPDVALLYYASPMPSLESPSAFISPNWTGKLGSTPLGYRIKRFRMEPNEADRIEGEIYPDFKVTSAVLGAFFTDTNT